MALRRLVPLLAVARALDDAGNRGATARWDNNRAGVHCHLRRGQPGPGNRGNNRVRGATAAVVHKMPKAGGASFVTSLVALNCDAPEPARIEWSEQWSCSAAPRFLFLHGGRRGAARRGDARARARPHARRRAPLRGGPLVLRRPRAPRRERDGRRAPLRPRRRRPAGERRVAYPAGGGIRDLKPLRLTSSLASQLEPWTVSNDAKPPRRVEIDVDWRRLPRNVRARKEPRSRINA